MWTPAAGYIWIDPSHDLQVRWAPGSTLSQYPHVVAGETEGNWSPAPGYSFLNNDANDLHVKWTPGIKNRDHPHVVAYDTEGSWVPEAGYIWTDKDKLLVAWQPGATDPQHPHIVASESEGYWHPENGYRFLSKDSLEVSWVGDTSGQNTLARVAVDLIGGAIAKKLSEDQEDDSAGMKLLGRPLAKATSDAFSDDLKDAIRGK